MSDFTIENLRSVEDKAPGFGMGEIMEARFAREALDAEATGFSYYRIRAGRRQPFGHHHTDAEEVYVVIAGSGRIKLEDEIRDIAALDAIRIAPGVRRALEASGGEDLELLAFGPYHKEDGEILPEFWPAD